MSNQASNQVSHRDSHKFKRISLPHQTENFSIIQRLSKKTKTPEEYLPLRQFPLATVADYVGIQTNYLCTILTGYKKPSPELHKILVELAQQVDAESKNDEVNSGENGGLN